MLQTWSALILVASYVANAQVYVYIYVSFTLQLQNILLYIVCILCVYVYVVDTSICLLYKCLLYEYVHILYF